MKLRRLSAPTQGLIALLFIASLMACIPLWFTWRQHRREQMRKVALPVTMQQAVPIIEAIQRYKQQHHIPPPTLAALLPEYLSHIPDAGPIAIDGWKYSVNDNEEKGEWELLVDVRDDYSPNILGFGDAFVFQSNGKFRRNAYGGVLLMMTGKWAYYVE